MIEISDLGETDGNGVGEIRRDFAAVSSEGEVRLVKLLVRVGCL